MAPSPSPSSSPSAETPYRASMSVRFVVSSVVTSCLLAFTIGRSARTILTQSMVVSTDVSPPTGAKRNGELPKAVLQEGKTMPRTIYTSKNFDTASSTASSLLIEQAGRGAVASSAKEDEDNDTLEDRDWRSCSAGDTCSRGKGAPPPPPPVENNHDEEEEDEEEHLPAGQHLLVDIKNVDAGFLNDEARLAQAMIDVVNDSRLTLLSYHCHGLSPEGVSCAGVLLESHVAFHTWPAEGVITLDLFTCGAGPLLPVVPIVVRLFSVPRDEPGAPEPSFLWAHKLRGFRNRPARPGHLDSFDLGTRVIGVMDFDMKKEVAVVETQYQRIDIYDLIFPRFNTLSWYERSMSNDGSYFAENPAFFLPDRQVYLDGVLQSSRLGDEAYHEGIVHPAMITHPNPKRVAIIGGGEGATLREILKYSSVETVTMIEIDELMVATAREHMPAWNTCDDIVGSTSSCFEDKRTQMVYEDAMMYFIDRYHENADSHPKYDVVVMDALDPKDNVEFADQLYNNDVFMVSVFNALNDDGIIAMQLGEAPSSDDPAENFSVSKNRYTIVRNMERIGFQSFHPYEEFHSNFGDPWTTIVVCRSVSCRANWNRSAAAIDLALAKRLSPTVSGEHAVKHFDGATMELYHVPHRAFEIVYCRLTPTPESCRALDKTPWLSWAALDITDDGTLRAATSLARGTGLGPFSVAVRRRTCDNGNVLPHRPTEGAGYDPATDREGVVQWHTARDVEAGEELYACV